MKLQTTIPLVVSDNPISYQSKLLLLGSCFVGNIDEKLDYYKFQLTQNPFGILFHPLAIENLLERALHEKMYQEEEIFEQDGIWFCFDAHSDLRSYDKNILLNQLNQRLKGTKLWLQSSSHIIITLGTAWVYRNNENGKIVANCHKVPQNQFSKELQSVESIKKSLQRIIGLIESINTSTKLIFTVSPVRHLKDGFIENQRSKAHLITALHQTLKSKNTAYFPSYEIMMDELRDYRFYGKDMVHPNQLAIDFIWEKFKSIWIAAEVFPTMEEVGTVRKGLLHRPFNPDSQAHQKFIKALQTKITYLQKRYSFMKF